ncbi:glycoside hydrolase family 27 protein [Pontiella sulfatireligans]|uniref:Alpha-galactosidase n=1 Tax=Pontiella sulfatireligans TaxID=2750658 RepID=A0A6C2UEW1_9BACT|nr:putative Ig domain-containing protein [Pontiella sulfatireligans]VGO18752.1 Alpha-galactosidase A [Pontiella sulfatireligans]
MMKMKTGSTRWISLLILGGSMLVANAQVYDATTGEKEILTPDPEAVPAINGPKVYGVRPGKKFVYRIPCQGERPISFKVKGLPKGLALDAEQGIITGVAPAAKGDYKMMFIAKNAHGKASRAYKLVVGDKIALTPPTGWNTWGGHMLVVSDQLMRNAADIFVERGLADVGYQYLGIDDCWMRIAPEKFKNRPEKKLIKHEGFDFRPVVGEVRDANGEVLANRSFPDMKAMTDYIHSKGLKAGLYSGPGPTTCQGFVGSYGHEAQDAATYAKWGFDFLKYDMCSGVGLWKDKLAEDPNYQQVEFWRPMSEALIAQDRDIVYNVHARNDPWKWGPAIGMTTWRTSRDLNATLKTYFDRALMHATSLREYSKPGQWNDPDYLYIHKIRDHDKMLDPTHEIILNTNQRYQYVTLWSMICAPMVFSCNIGQIDDFTVSLLANAEVLNINQDELGHVAEVVRNKNEEVILVKKLVDGSKAVAVFNTNPDAEAVIAVEFHELGLCCTQDVHDVWRGIDVGAYGDNFSVKVSPNGVGLFIVSAD